MKLILILILIFLSYEDCDYYHYYDTDSNYICTLNDSCPNKYNKLIPNKFECVTDCKNDTIYKYEFKNKCYENCPYPETELIDNTYCREICTDEKPYLNTLTHECVVECTAEDLLSNICVNYKAKEKEDIKDEIEKALSSNKLPNFDDDFKESQKELIITLTSTKIQKGQENNTYLKQCESLLKKFYNIPIEDDIYFMASSETEYEAYYKFNDTIINKLDMSICNNISPPEIVEYYNDSFFDKDIKSNIKKPFYNALSKECIYKSEKNDLINKLCYLGFELTETDKKITSDEYYEYQKLINEYFDVFITSEKYFNSYLSYLDLIDHYLISGNMKITLSTSENQKYKRDFINETSIDIGDCENKLKGYYKIDKIYLKKIDITDNFKKTTKIDYDFYGEINHSNHLDKLDKKVCKDIKITLFIPIQIKENLEEFTINGGTNTDISYRVISDTGNVLSSKERKNNNNNNNNNNNEDICQDGCEFKGYYNKAELAECLCNVKETSFSFGDYFKTDKRKLEQKFNSKNERDFFNLKVLTFNVLKSKDNIKSNIGFYILSGIIVVYITIVIIFYYKGYNWLLKKMDEVIQKKFCNVPINNNEINPINNNIINNNANPHKKTKKSREKKKGKKTVSLSKSNNSKNTFVNPINQRKNEIPLNVTSIPEQNMNVNMIMDKNIIQPVIGQPSLPEKDYELNWLSYNDALIYDKRTLGQYYCSLIRSKQLIFFSFCSLDDYNSTIIKKYFFFLSFATHYTLNAFFSSPTQNNRYEEKFDVLYHIPQMFYSSIISTYLVRILVRNLALTDKNVLVVKQQVDKNIASYMIEKTIKCVKIKFIVFFVLNMILLGFYWYFLTIFNAIYNDIQTNLIICTIISFDFSLLFPFFTNIFPALYRNCSLRCGNNCCCYGFSQINQLLL